MHILVADDDAVSRTAIRECLAEYRGLDIHDAASGEEAWEWLRNPDAPVLCLLDVRMPDLDGIGLMRRMREDMRFCQVPVMLITSNAQKEVVVEAAQLGLGGIVIKPVDPDTHVSHPSPTRAGQDVRERSARCSTLRAAHRPRTLPRCISFPLQTSTRSSSTKFTRRRTGWPVSSGILSRASYPYLHTTSAISAHTFANSIAHFRSIPICCSLPLREAAFRQLTPYWWTTEAGLACCLCSLRRRVLDA